MEKLSIVGWTNYDSEYPSMPFDETYDERMDLIVEEIKKNGYVFAGDHHQYISTGVPVFSDGTCYRASMRAWGGVMSEVYNGDSDGYMDYYMGMIMSEEPVFPEEKEIPVPPAEVEYEEDEDDNDDTASAKIPFLTMDKSLGNLLETLDSLGIDIDDEDEEEEEED